MLSTYSTSQHIGTELLQAFKVFIKQLTSFSFASEGDTGPKSPLTGFQVRSLENTKTVINKN